MKKIPFAFGFAGQLFKALWRNAKKPGFFRVLNPLEISGALPTLDQNLESNFLFSSVSLPIFIQTFSKHS